MSVLWIIMVLYWSIDWLTDFLAHYFLGPILAIKLFSDRSIYWLISWPIIFGSYLSN